MLSSRDLKNGLQALRITLCAFICRLSTQARVTSVKSWSDIRFWKVFLVQVSKSFQDRLKVSEAILNVTMPIVRLFWKVEIFGLADALDLILQSTIMVVFTDIFVKDKCAIFIIMVLS